MPCFGKRWRRKTGRIAKVYTHVGLNKVEVEEGKAGDIIELAGLNDINIGDTICDFNHPEKIPFVDIDEPTVSMTFSVNNGPFAGKEGQFITSRHIRDRLFKELERNVSLRVKETDSADSFEVCGRVSAAPAPDLVIYLDMDPNTSRRLLERRYGGDASREDLHESNLKYLLDCRQAALYAAGRWGWRRIGCCNGADPLPPEVIHRAVLQEAEAFLRGE